MKIKDVSLNEFLAKPGKKIKLQSDYDPKMQIKGLTPEIAEQALRESTDKIAKMQSKLYAQDVYGVLILFQALDAAGKDGTIAHVMSGINPQGCEVTAFKSPSSEELDHDYLWRCAKKLPERGRIGIFNRSYYEEVLVVRVHPTMLKSQKLPKEVMTKTFWNDRFEQINNFEKYLVDNGIEVIKIFLNVSKAEQKNRLMKRIDNPEKNWKFSASDLKERKFFDDYIKAYEDCINNTSTKWAPWYIVPADHKPSTRIIVSEIIGSRIKDLNLHYPKVSKESRAALLQAKGELETE